MFVVARWTGQLDPQFTDGVTLEAAEMNLALVIQTRVPPQNLSGREAWTLTGQNS